MNCHFTEKRPHHDPDGDSGMGPSTFTDTKSTTFSEVSYTVCIAVCKLLPPAVYVGIPAWVNCSSSLGSSGQGDERIRL